MEAYVADLEKRPLPQRVTVPNLVALDVGRFNSKIHHVHAR